MLVLVFISCAGIRTLSQAIESTQEHMCESFSKIPLVKYTGRIPIIVNLHERLSLFCYKRNGGTVADILKLGEAIKVTKAVRDVDISSSCFLESLKGFPETEKLFIFIVMLEECKQAIY